MRKRSSLLLASLLFCLVPLTALADVSDYLGGGPASSKCPRTIVVRPDITDKNVFVPVDASDMQTASQMIGSTVAGKFEGARVITAKEINDYKVCDVPVVLAKLTSYTTEPAIFGQHEGKAAVQILRFRSPAADAPEKEVNVSANGERHWGDSVPFMNAIKAVCDKIQKTNL